MSATGKEHPESTAAKGLAAMDDVAGENFAELVERHGPLPVDAAVECVLEAAKAIDAAYRRGLSYNSIVPETFAISDEGTVTVAASAVSLLEPPDEQRDVNALGRVLYFLLTGRRYRSGQDLAARLVRLGRARSLRALRDDVSEKLDIVFQRMTARMRARRYASVKEMVAELAACRESG